MEGVVGQIQVVVGLGHPIDDRVPFWGDSEFLQLTYPDLKRSAYRVIVMAWGEGIHYRAGG
jgi:hypothetical protein